MGVIKSQSIYATLYSYIGVAIGFVTSALLMPKVFLTDQLGYFKLIVTVTAAFSAIFSLGVNQLLIRMFPIFEHSIGKQNKLLSIALKVAFIGSVAVVPFFLMSLNEFLNHDEPTNGIDKNTELLILIYLSISSRIIYNALFNYTRMFDRIVIDVFLNNILQKGWMLLLLILYYFEVINFNLFIYLYLFIFLLFPIILIVYYKINSSKFNVPMNFINSFREKANYEKKEKKEFLRLILFGTLTTIGGSIYLYLDTFMINFYLSESEVGIYGTMYLFGVIVIIPARGLKSISISILSKSFKTNDLDQIKSVYKKSSITLAIVGGLIFLGVWMNMYSVLSYLPADFQKGEFVVLFIGIAHLFDMFMGVNAEIISASKMYAWNTWFILISIFFGIITNMIFIPLYGITGAALATLITIFIVNTLRFILLYRIYKLHPFSSKSLILVLVISFTAFCVSLLTNDANYVLNIFTRGVLICLIYINLIYFLKLSNDINQAIDTFLKQLKSIFK